LGILIAGLHALRQGGRRLDGIDKALLAYVAVATIYMLFPHLFSAYHVTTKWNARLLSWRADCGYVLIFFGVRHAPISSSTRKWFERVIFGMATLTVIVGFYQWAQPDAWANFVLRTGHIQQYFNVLGAKGPLSQNLNYIINERHPLRVSSVLISPFDMADYLLLPWAIAVERLARHERPLWAYLLCPGILAMLYASRVRADSLAAVVLLLLALIPAPKRTTAARLQMLAAIAVAAIVIVPSLGGTRFVNAEGGGSSNTDHFRELRHGITELSYAPLGLGIGNVAGVGDRFYLGPHLESFTIDNAFLQVSGELGIQALIPWLILLILTWRALGRAARKGDAFVGGVRLAFLAILIAGLYHQPLLTFPVPWTLFAAMGLALKPSATSGTHSHDGSRSLSGSVYV
jgi:hypothetical protein